MGLEPEEELSEEQESLLLVSVIIFRICFLVEAELGSTRDMSSIKLLLA